MKPAVECEFRMECYAQFLAVEHTHHLLTEVDDRRAFHRGLVKPWCPDEHAWKALAQSRSSLRRYFERLMRESVASCWLGVLIGSLGDIQAHIKDGFERFSLSTPSVASNTCSEVRFSPVFGCGQQYGSGTGSQNGTLGMGVHPRKDGVEEGFVTTGDAHGGGFPARQHQRVKRSIDVCSTAAFHDFDLKTEFFGRPAQRLSMLMTSTLKHGQTHTEHGPASMPFPISPTLEAGQNCGHSSMHFKDRRDLPKAWPTAAIASSSPAPFA